MATSRKKKYQKSRKNTLKVVCLLGLEGLCWQTLLQASVCPVLLMWLIHGVLPPLMLERLLEVFCAERKSVWEVEAKREQLTEDHQRFLCFWILTGWFRELTPPRSPSLSLSPSPSLPLHPSARVTAHSSFPSLATTMTTVACWTLQLGYLHPPE